MNFTVEENKNISVDVKFAHGEGHTVFAISDDSQWLLTGGIDGEVRKWSLESGNEDEDPESFDVGSPIFALEIAANTFYVGSKSIDAKSFQLDDGSYLGRFARFSSYTYCLDLSNDKKSIAVGSGDFLIKVIDLESSANVEYSGHSAPILSVKFDPKNRYLASTSCDGSAVIWDLKTQDKITTLSDICDKSNDFGNAESLSALSWNASGTLLALPVRDEIHLINRDTWDVQCRLKVPGGKIISIVSFDPSNRYLAAAEVAGRLLVWNLVDKSEPAAVYVSERDAPITCIRFSPKEDRTILATDKNGQLLFIQLKDVSAKLTEPEVPADDQFDMLDFDDDDDFTEEAFLKAQEEQIKKTFANPDPESSEPDHKAMYTTIVERSQSAGDGDQHESDRLAEVCALDDFDDDDELVDIGALKAKYESKIFGSKESDSPTASSKVEVKSPSNEKKTETKKDITVLVRPLVQDAFQPGSTPVDNPDRYMVWNSVGIVKGTQNDQYESSIDVEFHDSTIYRPIHLSNVHNYTMADLSTDSLLLAVPKLSMESDLTSQNEPSDLPSHVFCMHFASWDANKEWRFDMPIDESIEAITLSSSFAIVATDRRNIRLYTMSGIQLHVFPLPGPVVCMAAQDNQLLIVFHHGSGLPGEQCLSMYVCRVSSKSLMPITNAQLNSVAVPLNPKSLLLWAGFTDEGSVCTVDSGYVLRIYKHVSRHWMAMADLQSRNKNDTYFVISVSEIHEQIRAISCRGAKYPLTFPKPTVISLPFEVLLCESGNNKTKLEEQLIRINSRKILLDDLSEKGFDVDFSIEENNKKLIEILIKLFAVAINANSNALAIEIAYLMPNEAALEGAIRYASQKRKQVLVNKLNQILTERSGESNVPEDFEYDEVPTRKRLINKNATSKNDTKSFTKDETNDDAVIRPKHIKLINSSNPFRKN